MTTRRQFIKTGAMAVAGTALLSETALAAGRKKGVVLGLQLYSVREDMGKDPLGTLKKLAEMGYPTVEHANYSKGKFYGYSPAEFKKILADLGMSMPSGHSVLLMNHWDDSKNDFTDEWKKLVADSAEVGQKFVVSPWLEESLRSSVSDIKKLMDIFNKSGELCQEYGMKFGYHNHDFEFYTQVEGQLLYDLIMDNTDPALVSHQMDIGNMYGAGGRALEILKKYPGRYESMHVKDEIKSETGPMSGYESTILGEGVVPVKKIMKRFLKKGGTEYFIVEQEAYQGKAPIDCMKENYEIMKKWGYY